MLNKFNLTALFSDGKLAKYKMPLIILVAGVMLLLFSGLFGGGEKSKTEVKDTDQYVAHLQKTLQNNIKKLNSVEDCSVMITLAASEENTYLENSDVSSTVRDDETQSSAQRDYLVIDGKDGDQVVVESKKFPRIQGVLVVYKGVDNITIKKNILDAVSTVLGIKSNKVFVVSTLE